jgi:DNA-binding FadR family transcriptional regulator
MIEPPAARLAASRATDAEIEALREAVERNDASRVVLERARWDLAIHRIVSRMPHNPMIETTFESIVPLIFELMLRSLSDRTVVAASAPYHRALYEAIRDRRPEDAYDAMLAHHESGRLVYDADLDSSIHEVAQRELAKLLGPSASMERIVSEVLREPPLATSVLAEAAPGSPR